MTRRRKIILAAVAAAVLAVPVAADRIAATVIEGRLAARLKCAAGLATEPRVSLGGFPALTQLAAGRLDEVRVSATEVPLARLTVRAVSAEARSVRTAAAGGATIGSVRVTATVGYDRLPLGGAGGSAGGAFTVTRIGGDDAGRLVLETEVTMRGITLPAIVYAEPALTGNTLTVRPAEVELATVGLRVPASRLPGGAGKAHTVALPPLPGGLGYRAVEATPDGLRLIVEGGDLRLGGADAPAGAGGCRGDRA